MAKKIIILSLLLSVILFGCQHLNSNLNVTFDSYNYRLNIEDIDYYATGFSYRNLSLSRKSYLERHYFKNVDSENILLQTIPTDNYRQISNQEFYKTRDVSSYCVYLDTRKELNDYSWYYTYYFSNSCILLTISRNDICKRTITFCYYHDNSQENFDKFYSLAEELVAKDGTIFAEESTSYTKYPTTETDKEYEEKIDVKSIDFKGQTFGYYKISFAEGKNDDLSYTTYTYFKDGNYTQQIIEKISSDYLEIGEKSYKDLYDQIDDENSFILRLYCGTNINNLYYCFDYYISQNNVLVVLRRADLSDSTVTLYYYGDSSIDLYNSLHSLLTNLASTNGSTNAFEK